MVNTQAVKYTGVKINEYAREALGDRNCVSVQDITIADDNAYLMAIFLALNSTDQRCEYIYEGTDAMLVRDRYGVPNFVLRRKKAAER